MKIIDPNNYDIPAIKAVVSKIKECFLQENPDPADCLMIIKSGEIVSLVKLVQDVVGDIE